MSNLAELLQSLVGKNSEVIGVGGQVLTLAGGFLGAAADVGGALALIFGASGSDIEADLQEIRDSLYHILETVNEINWRERWDDINSRLSTVDQTMKEPYSVVSTLQLDLAAEPPLDEAARSDRVQKCFAALVLGKDEYWNLPNTDLDYYRDPWNSEMHP
jgi:hypothetical protein